MLFDFGMSSLGGKDAILKLPGVNLTTAGKNKRVIAMDASLLNGFSMRLPQAIQQLHEKLFGK
ncbi:Hemin-binding periplasmic protein HmuT [compost metagenome]